MVRSAASRDPHFDPHLQPGRCEQRPRPDAERSLRSCRLGRTITQLDRQRMIGSASFTYYERVASHVDGKLKVHGEVQGLPSGTRLRAGDETPEALPSDWGTTLGAQLGVWHAPGDDDTTGYRRHA